MTFKSIVVFRVDASSIMGNGHVMRSIALAKGLKLNGIDSVFLSKELDGNLNHCIEKNGFEVVRIESELSSIKSVSKIKPILLVIDHYSVNYTEESGYKEFVKKLFVIDDLANRKHNCDILLDQNLGRKKEEYKSLVGENTKLLIGPKFALTRDEFAKYRETSLRRKGKGIKQPFKIMVSMGGTDQGGYTHKVIEAIADSNLHVDTIVNILISSNSSNLLNIKESVKLLEHQANLIIDPSNVAELMCHSDFSIGALGSTSWERCILGLPSISVCLANNQKLIGESLAKIGATLVIDRCEFKDSLIAVLSNIKNGKLSLSSQSEIASMICDGLGVKRVIDIIKNEVFQ